MEHSVYLNGLKVALKARDITYFDLAESLKMSESGVKKMLNAKDISFRRVLQICEVLDVLPGQIFSLSEKSSIPILQLTIAQEEALISNRQLLMVYWRFSIEKLSLEEILKILKINEFELKKLFQKLVSLELITQKRGRFLPKRQGKFRWPEDSKLARLLNQEWSQHVLKKALKKENKKAHRFIAMKLSEESYQEFQSRLSILFDEFVQISEREELTSINHNLKDVTAIFATIGEGVFNV